MNILKGELLGRMAAIADSKNRCDLGIRGKIIDETKHTIVLSTDKGPKRLFKKNIVLKIGVFRIDGTSLIGRPEDRVKRNASKERRA